jgi:hypothetical protein
LQHWPVKNENLTGSRTRSVLEVAVCKVVPPTLESSNQSFNEVTRWAILGTT